MRFDFGKKLKGALAEKGIMPFIGVYDTFSASLAARYFDGIFVSGFSFSASFYGLPDIGLISWSDIVDFVRRVRTILPEHHILVDIDDGYADIEVACHVVSLLESAGASGVIMEDQRRPKHCGHLDGRHLLTLQEFLPKLRRVMDARKEMLVVARTNAVSHEDILERIEAYDEAGADWLLADGISDLEVVRRLRSHTDKPLVFNQIAGGKSPSLTLTALKVLGISIVLYSTPCLFSAMDAIQESLRHLHSADGLLPQGDPGHSGLTSCTALLEENLMRPKAVK